MWIQLCIHFINFFSTFFFHIVQVRYTSGFMQTKKCIFIGSSSVKQKHLTSGNSRGIRLEISEQ